VLVLIVVQLSLNPPLNTSIFSNNRTGIEVGLAVDYAVSERLSISSQANITIFNGIFKNDAEPDVISRGMEIPAKLEFPIHFIFKYPLDKNKLQIILGPNFKYHMNSDVGPNRNELKSYDFALDIGIGFEKPTTYFNFIPKIKYSIGLLNLVNNKQFMYQRGIERLQLHTLTLCFDFKG